MDSASRRRAPARKCGDSPRPYKMPDAAFLGCARQRRQPVERNHPLYPPGVAGKAALEAGRECPGRGFWTRIQRGILAAAMGISVIAFLGLLLAVALLRLFELRVSSRNRQRMVAQGATKVHEPRFRWIVLLHTAVLICAALEVVLLRRPFIPILAAVMFLLFLGSHAVRLWCVRTMGKHWNVQVMNSTSFGVVTSGPFRFVRHPNYAAIFVEIFSFPMIHTAWLTTFLGF